VETNGVLLRTINFKNGLKEGKYTKYYDNEQPECVCDHKKGRANGLHTVYKKDGTIYHNYEVKNGFVEKYLVHRGEIVNRDVRCFCSNCCYVRKHSNSYNSEQ
jgi:hypothetical protein